MTADTAFDVLFRRPCSCPESHAGHGACSRKADIATSAGGMCAACARCREAETLDWAPLMHEIVDLHPAPVDWPGGKLKARGAQAGR